MVVLASDVRPEMLLRAVNDGATDFLTKPFNATEILLRVRNVLRARSLYLAVEALAVQDLDRSRLMSGRS